MSLGLFLVQMNPPILLWNVQGLGKVKKRAIIKDVVCASDNCFKLHTYHNQNKHYRIHFMCIYIKLCLFSYRISRKVQLKFEAH